MSAFSSSPEAPGGRFAHLGGQAEQPATPGCKQTPRRAGRPGLGPRRCASNPEEQPQPRGGCYDHVTQRCPPLHPRPLSLLLPPPIPRAKLPSPDSQPSLQRRNSTRCTLRVQQPARDKGSSVSRWRLKPLCLDPRPRPIAPPSCSIGLCQSNMVPSTATQVFRNSFHVFSLETKLGSVISSPVSQQNKQTDTLTPLLVPDFRLAL